MELCCVVMYFIRVNNIDEGRTLLEDIRECFSSSRSYLLQTTENDGVGTYIGVLEEDECGVSPELWDTKEADYEGILIEDYE